MNSYRCRDCKCNFVSSPEEVCEECAPSKCEYCKESTYVLHQITPTLNSELGSRMNVCSTCKAQVCRKCAQKSYSLSVNGICTNCRLEGWVGEPTHPGKTCKDCGNEYSSLDADGICKDCFDKNTPFQTNCTACGNRYEPTHESQFLCESCKPKCRGCEKKFNPVDDKTDSLCESCYKISNTIGNCSKCGDLSQLDESAHCDGCSTRRSHSSKEFCIECDVNKPTMGQICTNCLGKTKMCPRCLENSIESRFYICKGCREQQETKFRSKQ